MAIVGYRRVSTTDQRLDRQQLGDDLDHLFDDHASGAQKDREQLSACLQYVREGDTLRVYSADRLARSLLDLLHVVHDLTQRGVRVEFVKERLAFDASDPDPYARCLMQVMGAFAELELAINHARQAEGIEVAKLRGAYKGRQPALTPDEVRTARERRALGVPVARLARDHGVAKSTLLDALARRGPYSSNVYAA